MPNDDSIPRERRRRRTAAIVTGVFVLVIFLALGAENAFNLRFLHPHGSAQIVVFIALSVLAFLLLMALLFVLLRNIIKLYLSNRSRVLGARLRTRMVAGALLLSFAPVLSMFLFSYVLMNRSIDRWFSTPVTGLREDADSLARELTQYVKDNARAEAESLAGEEGIVAAFAPPKARRGAHAQTPSVSDELRDHRTTLQGGFAIVYRGSQPIAAYTVPLPTGDIVARTAASEQVIGDQKSNLPAILLAKANSLGDAILSIPTQEFPRGEPFVTATAPVSDDGTIVVGLPIPASLPDSIRHIQQGTRDYLALGRARHGVRTTFLLILVTLTVAVFFGASWLALSLSKQITRPVETLADAMAEIAAGRYGHRISQVAANELGRLFYSFNLMAADLETSRARLEFSTQELSLANRNLEARRLEIETILDTIPLAVLGLDAQGRVVHANPGFHSLMGTESSPNTVTDSALRDLFPEDALKEIERLIRRSNRMGLASKELEVRSPRGLLHLSAVIASMQRRGYILVLEDVTELLRAQKQAAWKEVAQRVAHEIKNPLTPIALSAERIRRYVDRDTLADNRTSVDESAKTITAAVETMRQLVDQFALLAQFPSAQPRAVDLNEIVENTLRLFAGRIGDVEIRLQLAPELPLVMADPNSLQRALANLVENAAEAMQGSLLRELTVQTSLTEDGSMAEIVIADTGHGLTEEDREQIFLPWFSTKQRGTGLGLSIVAQVVQEHHGSIRAEKNTPLGTRFIVELPLAEAAAAEDAQPLVTTAGTSA